MNFATALLLRKERWLRGDRAIPEQRSFTSERDTRLCFYRETNSPYSYYCLHESYTRISSNSFQNIDSRELIYSWRRSEGRMYIAQYFNRLLEEENFSNNWNAFTRLDVKRFNELYLPCWNTWIRKRQMKKKSASSILDIEFAISTSPFFRPTFTDFILASF